VNKSELEYRFEYLLRVMGIPEPSREYKFHPKRRWRFDFAWPDRKIAIELEGGIWVKGAHTRGKHFISDCNKYNAAALLGWRVFRFTSNHLEEGTYMEVLDELWINTKS